jgi:pyridoxal phosphate enzyme (YggS family)
MVSIEQNIVKVQTNIISALAKRRDALQSVPDFIKLVAVTKNHTIPEISTALETKVTLAIGENRVQEAATKYDKLPKELEWHLIGHLQTNKVRQAVPMFDLIHSVDSEKLALEIDHVSAKVNKIQDILIQVNAAGEETKFGIAPNQLETLVQRVTKLNHIRLCGLMTIAPFYDNVENVRPVFQEMYHMFIELKKANIPQTKIQWLSMGMTNDYMIAIEEGANLVRVGTGIFGPRVY